MWFIVLLSIGMQGNYLLLYYNIKYNHIYKEEPLIIHLCNYLQFNCQRFSEMIFVTKLCVMLSTIKLPLIIDRQIIYCKCHVTSQIRIVNIE